MILYTDFQLLESQAVNATVISFDAAPQGSADFDSRVAGGYVIDSSCILK